MTPWLRAACTPVTTRFVQRRATKACCRVDAARHAWGRRGLEWAKSIDGAGHAEVSLSLSLRRFNIGSSFELSSTLAAMGMPSAFGAGADFSGMTGTKDLFVTAVVHQAVLDVNESGAEASAATAVVMAEKGMPAYVPMRVDRPFYVMIRDHESGAVLFVAHVRNPAQAA